MTTEELNRKTKEFLSNGGKITVVPYGVFAEDFKALKAAAAKTIKRKGKGK